MYDTIADRVTNKAAEEARTAEVEFSQIWAERVIPTGSHWNGLLSKANFTHLVALDTD